MNGLNNLVGSASKIVFVLLAITACAGFLLKILEPKDFMLLSGMAFAFYFSYKGSNTNPPDDNAGAPYAGK